MQLPSRSSEGVHALFSWVQPETGLFQISPCRGARLHQSLSSPAAVVYDLMQVRLPPKPDSAEQINHERVVLLQEPNLRHTLQFGIGLHHAGLSESDRSIAETLFVAGKIQILVATSTLAWGVNTPAHLVIIKGTEFFDAPSRSADPSARCRHMLNCGTSTSPHSHQVL